MAASAAASRSMLASAAAELRGTTLPACSRAGLAASVAPAKASVVCRASQESADVSPSRRDILLSLAAAGSALVLDQPSANAAYGEAANVFGSYKGKTDFRFFQGPGYSLDVPAKWNPSKELGEFPNVVLRYEDNFDTTSCLTLIAEPTSLKSVKDLGTPAQFIEKYAYLLGLQSFDKETASEGGFLKNTTLTAALLDSNEIVKDGKTYFKVNILSRTADGDEGGKHQLFTAVVSQGKLYILKVQAGDKRWFKGARKFVEGADSSFAVA